ncbi:MAG: DUF1800 domain-containing protein [Acidobacteria bacterium]|nr:DUF1800 domain-containing protein [Acidobacteriota bacterium]
MATDAELISHALGRLTFGPRPGEVESLAPLGPAEVIARELAEPEIYFETGDDADLSEGELVAWWVSRMMLPEARLHERMTWFWHGHFTSSLDKCAPSLMWRQHHLLRRHALGNFRDLCHEITLDPAMLLYLDGAGSTDANPNENYARELMELFTLGINNYSEDDVRNTAAALTGWEVDRSDGEVTFDSRDWDDTEREVLGETRVWDVESIVDKVCDHPQCPRWIATKVYRYLVGRDPNERRIDTLAATFAEADLEIMPLVEAIVGHPDFLEQRNLEPIQPVEWLTRMQSIAGAEFDTGAMVWLERMGQVPFFPPNVAGWPSDERWRGPGVTLYRIGRMTSLRDRLASVAPEPDAVFNHIGVYGLSAATALAVTAARAESIGEDLRLSLLWLALSSPEFCTR